MRTPVKLKIFDDHIKEKHLYQPATLGSCGIDLYACIEKEILLWPGDTQVIGSGIAIDLEDRDIATLLLPRSGIGINHGIVLGNLVGLIDSDYTDEIKVAVWNRTREAHYKIRPYDKICQMIFLPIIKPQFIEEVSLRETKHKGLGSTGI